MLSDRRELPCQTVDISPGGVSLITPVQGEIGQRAVMYLDHLGRLEGDVVRITPHGMVVSLQLTPQKRGKIADKLTWLANRSVLGLAEDRRHERIEPIYKRVQIAGADGSLHAGTLVDVSLSGALVRAAALPNVGEIVTLGATRGRVVRHFDGAFAVEFLRLLPIETFDPQIRL